MEASPASEYGAVGPVHSNTEDEPLLCRDQYPRYLKDALPELRREARAVSRKKKGARNRRKAVKRLRKAHAKVKNQRKEHHHKVALRLVRRYGFDANAGAA